MYKKIEIKIYNLTRLTFKKCPPSRFSKNLKISILYITKTIFRLPYYLCIMNTKTIITFIFVALFYTQIPAQRIVTLAQVIDLTAQHNFGLRVADNNREVAENNATWGNAGLLPRVDLNGNYSYGESSTKATYAAIPPIETEAAGSRVYGGNVNASYVLFDGFRGQNTYKKAQLNFRLSDLAYRQEFENTIVNVISAYYEWVRLQEDEKIAAERFAITKEQLRQTEGRQQFGQATEANRLNALTAYNADSTALIRDRLTIRKVILNLNTLIGKKEINDGDIAENELTLRPDFDFEKLLEKAQQNNINLLRALDNIAIATYDIKLAKAARFPRIDLSTSYALTDQKNELGFLLTNQNQGWNTGATATYNIFNGSQTTTRIKNAKLSQESQAIALEQTRFLVEQDLLNAWLDYENNKTLLTIGENNVAIAKQSLDRTLRANRSGQARDIEVRDAQRAYAQAQNNLLATRLNIKLSEFEVLRVAGLLVEE